LNGIFRFVVEAGANGYISAMVSKAQRIVITDHARLPWRFFARLTLCAQTAL
jgi:3-methyladenine DNA glycosylase Mpg